MRTTDIAIAGAGLAGSLAAVMLARKGYSVVLADPNKVFPADFRCEKLDGPQMQLLEKTGLAGAVRSAATHDRQAWVARLGHLVEKRTSDQFGIDYGHLVNTIRGELPESVDFVHSKVTGIATAADRQTITLANGEAISARLAIVANGLNSGLRDALGMAREEVSRCHSVTIGFDVEPEGCASFPFRALTYYTECATSRVAYLTLFPIGTRLRANLFVYRDLGDPWLREFRVSPAETLKSLMPRLTRLTGDFRITNAVKIRPVDLYATRNTSRAGIVLVGDAFATSCPAAGTGARKALCDVERLCNAHVPQWLASPGMGEDKIAEFYNDPVKRASDRNSFDKAYAMRAMSIDTSPRWVMQRWLRFVARYGVGKLRNTYGVLHLLDERVKMAGRRSPTSSAR